MEDVGAYQAALAPGVCHALDGALCALRDPEGVVLPRVELGHQTPGWLGKGLSLHPSVCGGVEHVMVQRAIPCGPTGAHVIEDGVLRHLRSTAVRLV